LQLTATRTATTFQVGHSFAITVSIRGWPSGWQPAERLVQ
jgi:hypothetical protein